MNWDIRADNWLQRFAAFAGLVVIFSAIAKFIGPVVLPDAPTWLHLLVAGTLVAFFVRLVWAVLTDVAVWRHKRSIANVRRIAENTDAAAVIVVATFADDLRDNRFQNDAVRAIQSVLGTVAAVVAVEAPPKLLSMARHTSKQHTAHDLARTLARETKSHLIIWGRVVSHGGAVALDLHLTPQDGGSLHDGALSANVSSTGLRIPADLASDSARLALAGVAATCVAPFVNAGRWVGDALAPLVDALRPIIQELPNNLTTDARGAVLEAFALAAENVGGSRGDSVLLHEAVTAYRDALTEYTRDRAPLQWAMIQNNLGNALLNLGQRESGTARLDEAVTAYRDALKERTRDRVPLDWAMTQNNLGNALQTLGLRESGTARLDEAVTAYRNTLMECTRDRIPLNWAMTQNNLGSALAAIGERESGTTHLDEAVTAFQDSLQEHTRDRVPLEWAATQNNLGTALAAIGRRGSGTERLDEAISTYRNALKERTRDRVPLAWAATQNNLGKALAAIGERESGTARLDEAVTAYRNALKERTRDRVPLDWAMTQNDLGSALHTIGERGSRTALLEAVTAYREGLKERTRDRVRPVMRAQTLADLGEALEALGDLARDDDGTGAHEQWRAAADSYRLAIEEYEHAESNYAEDVRRNLARVEAKLAGREPEPEAEPWAE